MQLPRDELLFPELCLPTEARPRFYSVRTQSYPWKEPYDGGDVPNVRLHGPWLEVAGFTAGKGLSVQSTPGRILILLMEPPACPRRLDSVTFSKIVARNPNLKGDGVLLEHPGQLLNHHVLGPTGTTTLQFANFIGVEQDFAECFLAGDEDVNGDLALRLGYFCRTSNQLWLDLQGRYEAGL